MWIDTPDTNADTMCQSVGRCLGHTTQKNDSFPIYCTVKEIDDAINFFENNKSIPSGVRNKTTIIRDDYEWVEMTAEEFEEERTRRIRVKEIPLWNSKCSENNVEDIARMVCGPARANSDKDGVRVFHLDGPNYKEGHEKSWEALPEIMRGKRYWSVERALKNLNYSISNVNLSEDILWAQEK
jgi:hypothetical protein